MHMLHKLLFKIVPIVFVSNANALQFYDRTISFYDEGKKIETKSSSRGKMNLDKTNGSTSEIRGLDKEPFDWKNYESPESVQFWDAGGDFVPSLPWRYIASHPTEENVKNYIEWQNKKISLSVDLQNKISNHKAPSDINKESEQKIFLKNEKYDSGSSLTNGNIQPEWDKFEILYFYQSHCQYCQKSTEIVFYLKKMGAKIIPIQIDWDTSKPTYKNSVQYDENLNEQFHVSSTPTWILKSGNKTRRINGYATADLISEQAIHLIKDN